MSLEVSYPHIEKSEDHPARLRRTPRVRVAQIVMDYLVHGWSVDEMCRQHPYLAPAVAHAAMAYYFDHREEIDAEIRADWEEAERSRAESSQPAVMMRLKARGLL